MSDALGEHRPTLYVETVIGRGEQTILLLHGGGVGGWMWKPLIEHLGDEWTYVVPDLPGHDHSAHQDYRSHVASVEVLIRLIESRPRTPLTVVGFSLGAQLAVSLASQRPDLVDRVVVISAQAKPSRWPTATLALLALAAPLAQYERFARAQAKELFIPEALVADYLRTSRSLSRTTLLASVAANIRFTIPQRWRSFAGDGLVLVGANERRMMTDSANLVAESHASSVVEIVDGAGHGVPLQRPGWLAARLRRWLQ